MTESQESLAAFIVLVIVAIALIILAAVVLLGCDGRIQGTAEPQVFNSLPLGYEVGPMFGRWESGSGWRLDCGQQVFNGFAPAKFWTCWPTSGAFKAPSQSINALVVYDLAMGTDSSGVGEVQFVGIRHFYGEPLNTPLPDSLSSTVFTLHARYRSDDSLWTGESVFDTTLQEFFPTYDVRPAWRCTLWVSGAKVYPVAVNARLTRVTAPGGSRQEGGACVLARASHGGRLRSGHVADGRVAVAVAEAAGRPIPSDQRDQATSGRQQAQGGSDGW